MNQIEQDAQLIRNLGGPAAVAERLQFDKRAGGVQRVSNWMRRGIPADVKIRWPDLFLPSLVKQSSGSSSEGAQHA